MRRRTWAALGLAIAVTGGVAAFAGDEGRPEGRPDEAPPPTGLAEARALVARLADQAAEQRAQLEKTEESLRQARALVRLLDPLGAAERRRIEGLKAQEDDLAERVRSMERLVRRSDDPGLIRARKKLDQVRAALKVAEEP